MDLYGWFVIFILILLVLVFVGLPIGLSLGAAGVMGFLALLSPNEMMQIGNASFNLTTSDTLAVIPMYILMAQTISACDLAEDFYSAVHSWLYWIPGSLAVCSTLTAAGFAAISGSSTAATVTIGSVTIPPMLKRNYNKKLACGVVTSGGALGILIPPSLAFIIYGFLTGTSIAKLFIAGIVPGIVMSFLLIMASIIACWIKPSLAPEIEKPTWKMRWTKLPAALPLVVLAGFVSSFLYLGIATVTEVAGLGVLIAFVIGLVLRRLSLGKLRKVLLASVRTTGMIMLIVIGGVILAFVFTSIGMPHKLGESLSRLSVDPLLLLIIISIIFLILGCFLDAICIQMLAIPFLFPVVTHVGIDPIWFGVIVVINMEIGLLTPPVGVNLFALAGVVDSRISMSDIIKGSVYYDGVLALGLIVVMAFPQLSLWLPQNVK